MVLAAINIIVVLQFKAVALVIYYIVGFIIGVMVALYGRICEARELDLVAITALVSFFIWPTFVLGVLIEDYIIGGK